MDLTGASSLYFPLKSIIQDMACIEAVVPIGAAVPIPTAISEALYTACQCLKESFTKDYNYVSTASILYYT